MLLITVAGRRELPIEWLKASHVPIVDLTSLKPEFYNRHGVAIVITGYGLEASRKAVASIAKHPPQYVVNLGTAGATEGHSVGDLLLITRLYSKNSLPITLPDTVPFFLQSYQYASLFSSETPILDPAELPNDANAVDMEAYVQAEELAHITSFHCIKIVSDRISHASEKSYKTALPIVHSFLKQILAWMTPEPPRFSVIIPVYNRPELVLRAIASVQSQSYGAYELIVVNDGSTDETEQALSQIENIHLVHTKNHGVSAARNLGASKATGNWICFLDSDDVWLKDKLKHQAAFIKKYPFYTILQSEETWIRNGEPLAQKKYHQKQDGFIWRASLERCLISPSSVCIYKNFFDYWGGFNPDLPACEDYDLWLKITRFFPVGLDKHVTLIKYAGHPHQLSQLPVLDLYRLHSLIQARKRETLPENQILLDKLIFKKSKILRQGAEKRKNTAILEQLSILELWRG